MNKLDIDATLASVREAAELASTHPMTEPSEIACNVRGIELSIEFTRWLLRETELIPPSDLAAAVGMMLGRFAVTAMSLFSEAEVRAAVFAEMTNQLVLTVRMYQNGAASTSAVPLATKDVGDA